MRPRGSLSQRSCNSDTLYTRLGLLLSRDSNNSSRSFTEEVSLASINSKPVSSNGSPVSTLTGSSETEHKAIKEQSSDSIGSLMSMSGQSNGSSSPLTRRHSVTSECVRFRSDENAYTTTTTTTIVFRVVNLILSDTINSIDVYLCIEQKKKSRAITATERSRTGRIFSYGHTSFGLNIF